MTEYYICLSPSDLTIPLHLENSCNRLPCYLLKHEIFRDDRELHHSVDVISASSLRQEEDSLLPLQIRIPMIRIGRAIWNAMIDDRAYLGIVQSIEYCGGGGVVRFSRQKRGRGSN